MRTSKRSFSLFSTMITELLFFIMISVVIAMVVGVLAMIKFVIEPFDFYDTPFIDNSEKFQKGDFKGIDVHRQLGDDGYFVVYDDSGNVIFSSSKKYLKIERADLELVPLEKYAQIKKAELGDGSVLIVYKDIMDEEVESISIREESIEHSSMMIDKKNLDSLERDLLSGKYMGKKVRRQKFDFQGKKFNVVFFSRYYIQEEHEHEMTKRLMYILILSICIIIITLLIYIYRISRKVTKPLKQLQRVVENFEVGKDVDSIYKGPSEFRELWNRFEIMAKKLAQLENEKVEAAKERQRILSDISHDFKTPMAVIRSYGEAVNSPLLSMEEKQEYLKVINNKIDTLTELINEFSDYNKLESPDFKLELKEENIYEYVRDYFIYKYYELEFLGCEVEIDIPEKVTNVMVDGFQMKRVFDNIISNTIKHNKTKRNIFIRVREELGNVFVYIGDDGKGIPSSIRENIFQPFIMGDKSRKTGEGSGLGLSIVKKIVEFHGGNIRLLDEAESKISTEYEIKLPEA